MTIKKKKIIKNKNSREIRAPIDAVTECVPSLFAHEGIYNEDRAMSKNKK
jgi:hypothetical protein